MPAIREFKYQRDEDDQREDVEVIHAGVPSGHFHAFRQRAIPIGAGARAHAFFRVTVSITLATSSPLSVANSSNLDNFFPLNNLHRIFFLIEEIANQFPADAGRLHFPGD